MMNIETMSERLHTNSTLTGLMAWKDFIAYSCSESYKPYNKTEIKISAKVIIKIHVQFRIFSLEVLNWMFFHLLFMRAFG
jgi:hypothetical protein